jgi:PKD repeat protein
VRLVVGGPFGTDELLRSGLVVVGEPPPTAGFQAGTSTGFPPLVVQFTDRSSGPLSAHSWSFGDGASSLEANPAHVYTAPGTYDVTLVVSGPGGTDLEAGTVTVLDPVPAADFVAGPPSGVAPLEVQFADASSGWVSAWSWSFGDGATSSEPNPRHTYTTPGTYAVSLTASGPAGSDLETKAGFVTVQWPAPVPEFSAGPVAGFAPLPVAFTDLSSGSVTSWWWTFGDGTRSRARHPVKVYTRAGAFDVTLTVRGPGGTRSLTRGGIAVAAMPQLPDGGFELQTAGEAPRAPWSELDAAGALVRSGAAPDAGFPREGERWLELDGSGSTAATPPSNPGGIGEAAAGTAGVEQVFPFEPLAPHLVFDAALLLGEAEDSQAGNDFLSVDLSDGTTSWNLHYADSFSELPGWSVEHALPMTAVQRVHVDLRELFPDLAAGAPLRLRIGVGNGGDGANPSRAYVDAFRLVPAATAAFRNGTGRNAPRYVSSPAVLGGAWTIQVDTTGHAGVRGLQLLGMQRPASGLLRVAGELLVSGKKVFAQSWPAQSGLNVRTIALPADLTLMGLYMATQVTLTGGGAELCNAYDLVLGF